MMSEKLNAALIDKIYEQTPEGANPANLLSDTLNIGREAAYRRLRGEVLFTFSEAALLSRRLNFSLDRTLGIVGAGNMMFSLQFTDFYSTLEKYCELLSKDIKLFGELASDPEAVFATAGTPMPAEYYMRRPTVAKFKFFKWLYQYGLVDPSVRTFEDMQVPTALSDLYGEYIHAVEGLATGCYVFDYGGFRHWVNAICAFRRMHLISDESIKVLKTELLQVLDEMELITIRGTYTNGNKVMFYLSDIDLESAYSYLSTKNIKATSCGVFSLNSLRTTDPVMFDHVKRWVQTQMRFSTLITGSGELQRIRYFQRQRAIVNDLDKGEGFSPSPELIESFR